MTEVTEEKGRQGETRNEMRWVLLISTILAVLVLGAFLFFSVTGEEQAGNAQTSMNSQTQQTTEYSGYKI